MPGISAVSPPTSAQPACLQPSAMPLMTVRACSTDSLPGGKIIQKEQWFSALHDEVVDAHRDQVDADGIMQSGLHGDFQLGANAVGGGDQNRVDEAGRLQVEQRAKAAQATQQAATRSAAGQRLDRLHQSIAGGDIDPGPAIIQASRCRPAVIFRAGHRAPLQAKPSVITIFIVGTIMPAGSNERQRTSRSHYPAGRCNDGLATVA